MSCYLVNRSSLTVLELKFPYQVQSGSPVDYSKLRVFGCTACAHIKEDKLSLRAKKGIFLSYAFGVKGYQLWCVNPKSPKFITSKDVIFDESNMFQKEKKSIGIDIEMNQSNSKQVELEVRASKTVQKDNLDKLFKEVVQHIIVKNAPKEQPYSIAIGRQRRQIKTPIMRVMLIQLILP